MVYNVFGFSFEFAAIDPDNGPLPVKAAGQPFSQAAANTGN